MTLIKAFDIMKHFFVMPLFFSLLACGDLEDYKNSFKEGVPFVPRDPAFNDIISDFEKLTGKKINMPVIFTDKGIPKGSLAVCIFQSLDIWTIKVHSKLENVEDELLRAVLYHELAHCALGRKHNFRLHLKLKNTVLTEGEGKARVVRKNYQVNSLMWPDLRGARAAIQEGSLTKENHYIRELLSEGLVPLDSIEVKDFSSHSEAVKNLVSIETSLSLLAESSDDQSEIEEPQGDLSYGLDRDEDEHGGLCQGPVFSEEDL